MLRKQIKIYQEPFFSIMNKINPICSGSFFTVVWKQILPFERIKTYEISTEKTPYYELLLLPFDCNGNSSLANFAFATIKNPEIPTPYFKAALRTSSFAIWLDFFNKEVFCQDRKRGIGSTRVGFFAALYSGKFDSKR